MKQLPIHEIKGQGQLCKLSAELLTLIASFCEPIDLCALARTCRLLYQHAMPALCRTVVVKQEQTARLLGFLALLRPHLLEHIRNACLHLDWGPGGERIRVVESMTKLQQLSIRYIHYSVDHDDYMPILPVFPTTLRTCNLTIHVAVGFITDFPAEYLVSLFKLPSLRQLSLCGVGNLYGDANAWDAADDCSTPLEELNLAECRISPEHLRKILEYPRALKRFSIWQFIKTISEPATEPPVWNNRDFFKAISDSPCNNSLEAFRFDMSWAGYAISPEPGMHELTGVRYLEVLPNHMEDMWEDRPGVPVPDIGFPLEQLLPPNLEILKIPNSPRKPNLSVLWRIIEKKDELFPSLKRIILGIPYHTDAIAIEISLSKQTWTPEGYGYFAYSALDHSVFPMIPMLNIECEKKGVEIILRHESPINYPFHLELEDTTIWEDARI